MGFRNKVYVAAAIIITTVVSIMFSLLLLENQNLAIAIYVISICLLIIFIEPFIGVVNYFLFLYMRPQEFLDAFRGIPIIIIMVGVTFVAMLIRGALDRRSMVRAPQDLFIIWLYAAIMLSQMAQLYIGGVIDSGMNFLHVVLSYFFIVNLVNSQKKMEISLYAIIILTVYLAVAGIVQYYTGTSFGVETVQAERRIRGLGIFNDPNDLAMALLIATPFLVLKIQSKISNLKRYSLLGLLLILLYALFLTNSRGGMLGFMVLMGLVFLEKYGKKVGVAMSVIAVLGMFAMGPSRIGEISPHEASAYGRVESWAAGFDMFTTHPVFGVGINGYTDYHPLVAHNSFIHCAAELGMFGLYPWVFLIFISVKNLYFVKGKLETQPPSDMDIICNSLLYSLLMFVVTTLFLSRVYSELLYIYVGFSAAYIQMYKDQSSAEYKLMEPRDLLQAILLIFGGLFVLKVFLILYW